MQQVVFKQTMKGVGALALREIIALPIGVVVSITLARLLTPAEFGAFSSALFLVLTVASTTEVGLGMTLIQQKEEPTVRELRTFFTFRAVVLGAMVFVLWVLASPVASLFRLGEGGASFIRFLAISLAILPIHSGSQVQLTRGLAYPTLATIEFVQGVTYQAFAVLLAWKGYGLWGLGVAHLLSWSVRALLFVRAAPWPIGFSWDREFFRRAIVYGGQVQLSGMTSILRDNIAVLLAGPLFGPQAVGYLNWARQMASQVGQLFAALVSRVSFPSFARIQADSAALSVMLRAVLRYVNVITLPLLAVLCALAPETVRILYTDRWAPAIPALYLMIVRMVAGNLLTPLDSLLKATGRAGRSLRITTSWTTVDWALCLAGVALFGYVGVAVGYAVGGVVAVVWFFVEVRRFCRIDLGYCLVRPMVAASVVIPSVIWLKDGHVNGLLSLVGFGIFGLGVYWLVLWSLERMELVGDVRRHFALVRQALARGA